MDETENHILKMMKSMVSYTKEPINPAMNAQKG